MIATFIKIKDVLRQKEKRQIVLLFFFILLLGLLEVVGVASILPFMELAARPEAIEQSTLLSTIYEKMEFQSHRQMLIYFGCGVFAIIAISNILGIIITWFQYKISWDIAHNFSTRILSQFIRKPYAYFLNINSASLKTYVVAEVNNISSGIILPALETMTKGFVSLVIFGLLLYVSPRIAIIMFLGLGTSYFIIYLSRKKYLSRLGKERISTNIQRYLSLDELLSGIKTISVYNQQGFFYDRYKAYSRKFSDIQPRFNIISSGPKFLIEFLAFGTILFITIYIFISKGNIQDSIPRLSLYAVAGYRLLPALQRTFAAITKIKHNIPILDKLYPDLKEDQNIEYRDFNYKTPPLKWNNRIELRDIRYKFAGMDQWLFDGLDLHIQRGTRIALIGSTGSGKTTIADIVCGLLTPHSGQLIVDDQEIGPDIKKGWQSNIAYVPQESFLFDDTIRNNITLGRSNLDERDNRLIQACKMADIYLFIKEELPLGMETVVGEKGVRLSGGQRQRITLARALYDNPSLLILDEATSALDNVTEKNIIDSLEKLPSDLTVIIIAHRLSTIKYADMIYVLENGQIIDSGNYNDLSLKNGQFQKLVEAS